MRRSKVANLKLFLSPLKRGPQRRSRKAGAEPKGLKNSTQPSGLIKNSRKQQKEANELILQDNLIEKFYSNNIRLSSIDIVSGIISNKGHAV